MLLEYLQVEQPRQRKWLPYMDFTEQPALSQKFSDRISFDSIQKLGKRKNKKKKPIMIFGKTSIQMGLWQRLLEIVCMMMHIILTYEKQVAQRE